MDERRIESLMEESRCFEPPAAFRERARIRDMESYRALYERSLEDPEGFWSEIAHELHWFRRWDAVLSGKLPQVRWFDGAQTNMAYNCLDRHLEGPQADRPAIIWEGEPGDVRTLSFRELHAEVSRFANALKDLGVHMGDRVCIYMPMVPEAAIAMLACARIGAPHSVVFGGFSAHALSERIEDAGAKVVITADGGWRRGKVVELKATLDEALELAPTVETVIVLKRTGVAVRMDPQRDHWWHALVERAAAECPAEPVDAEHLLFILYTSGTTGKPKGIMHTTGGYMVGAYVSSRYVFDLRADDVFWCTADVGWITGHTYVVYGALLNGVATLMYEGAPDHPARDRFWQICERHGVTIFYTAPTAIRAFMRWGEEHVARHDLSRLRLLGTVGEPINPEAWMWYRRVIGGDRCPVVDTWWQTETGSIMIAPLPGATPTCPGSATLPFFGVDADIVDEQGNSVPPPGGGYLVIRRPWPSMLRGIYGNEARYLAAYWERFEGLYFTGDGARRDERGYFWLLGRVDDVLNVAGHRLGTAEIESALVAHPAVAEAAVVGFPHEIKGEGIAAFCVLRSGHERSPELADTLAAFVAEQIGPIARPDQVRLVDALPKTRSGKIMRRLLRAIASGEGELGDTTTLEDAGVIDRLQVESDETAGVEEA